MFGQILGGLIGAGANAYASRQAGKISRQALADQKAQQERVWSSVDPYMKLGQGAASNLADPAKNFTTSPGYNFRLDQGLEATAGNQAVNGLLRSGGALKALNDYGQGMASSEFNNWFGQQQSLVNSGLSASGIGAGVANQNTAAIGTDATNRANAGFTGANAWGSIAGQIGAAYDNRGVSSYKKG